MSSNAQRVAELRRRRKLNGLKQTTIWMTPEDHQIVRSAIEHQGLKNVSEVVSYALRMISNQDQKMQI